MKPAYVLKWRSPQMSAPAFWYFSSQFAAEDARDDLHKDVAADIAPTQVPDDFDLFLDDVELHADVEGGGE